MEWKMEWNGNFGMENGMEDFKNEKEDNLPYFHTNSMLDFEHVFTEKYTVYECGVVINDIVTEVFNFNIYAYYLSTNNGTLVVHYILRKQHCIIVSTGTSICSSDVIIDDFNRFDLFLLFCN